METWFTNVSWAYVLGLAGLLFAIVYFTNVLKSDVGGLNETLSELAISAENVTAKLFNNGAPVSLTATGYHVLHRSGLKSYIDAKKPRLLAAFSVAQLSDLYETQRRAFRLLADLPFEETVAHHLNKFAFNNGISTSILRRVGAIYLFDIAVSSK